MTAVKVVPARAATPLARLDRVVLEYPNVRALDRVSLRLEQGELAVLVGPTGAGKTSLLRLLSGELRPTAGEVWLDGQRLDRARRGRRRAVRRGIGIISHDYALSPKRTALENVALALEVADLGLPRSKASERAREQLAAVGLGKRTGAYPRELSAGERRRVVVARALVRKPHLVLADEPTAELDAARGAKVLDLLAAAAQTGATVVIATHTPELLKGVRVRILTLRSGRLVGDEVKRPHRLWLLN
jgi:cell division transport system ATP-binding protein